MLDVIHQVSWPLLLVTAIVETLDAERPKTVFLGLSYHPTVVGLLLEVGREAFCEDIQI